MKLPSKVTDKYIQKSHRNIPVRGMLHIYFCALNVINTIKQYFRCSKFLEHNGWKHTGSELSD